MQFFSFLWGLCLTLQDIPSSFTTFHSQTSWYPLPLDDPSSGSQGSSDTLQSVPVPKIDILGGGPGTNHVCNTAENRSQWCYGLDITSDYELLEFTPNTGVTNQITLVVSNGQFCGDGYCVDNAMLINGTYPGPPIIGDWGDNFEITVINNLSNCNGTSMHWHGLRQWKTVWADGVPGVTQCPIPPGGSQTYKWRAMQYGASWYHSHFSLQYADGVAGPLIINGPTSANFDFDNGPLMIADWFHADAFSIYFQETWGDGPPVGDSTLVNGNGNYTVPINNGTGVGLGCSPSGTDPNCQPQSASVYLSDISQKGKKYKYSIINASVNSHFTFWIDGHDFEVVTTDFVAITPFITSVLNVAIGQRYEIIVTANADTSKGSNFWMNMRSCDLYCIGEPCVPDGSHDCLNDSFQECRQGILSYNLSDTSSADLNAGPYQGDRQCLDEDASNLVPVVSRTITGIPAQSDLPTYEVSRNHDAEGNMSHWSLSDSGTSFLINWGQPSLLLLENGTQANFPQSYAAIPVTGSDDTWFAFVVDSNWTANSGPPLHRVPAAHPIHLHGHDFAILAQDTVPFDPTFNYPLNLNNPPRRDVAMLPVDGFLMLAFQTDNPGSWIMHCHIAWHASAGLGIQFVERESEIPGLMQNAPGVLDDLNGRCQAWNSYYGTCTHGGAGYGVQDDSGVKFM